MQYTSIDGTVYERDTWLGSHVALLTPQSLALDAGVMSSLLAAFDAGYRYYWQLTAREPAYWAPTTFEGRTTITVVDTTCGAGCGYLGARGIELLPDWFGAGLIGDWPDERGFYDAMSEQGTITSIIFYELGRNFWFYGDQLTANNQDLGFVTAYAIVNRE